MKLAETHERCPFESFVAEFGATEDRWECRRYVEESIDSTDRIEVVVLLTKHPLVPQGAT